MFVKAFVSPHSVVRKIWGNPDTILFIFAGASAEFALNKAVDWLFFTGKLPADPLGRLFSTVSYARRIVFSTEGEAYAVIDRMAHIHTGVESQRGYKIPDWAYRDVLYMLIDYSIRSFEILKRIASDVEKEEVFHVFRRVGDRMGIPSLPLSYTAWVADRRKHIEENLENSDLTSKLFAQYKIHLGAIRFMILRKGQSVILPPEVATLLGLKRSYFFGVVVFTYKLVAALGLGAMVRSLILHSKYSAELRALESDS